MLALGHSRWYVVAVCDIPVTTVFAAAPWTTDAQLKVQCVARTVESGTYAARILLTFELIAR